MAKLHVVILTILSQVILLLGFGNIAAMENYIKSIELFVFTFIISNGYIIYVDRFYEKINKKRAEFSRFEIICIFFSGIKVALALALIILEPDISNSLKEKGYLCEDSITLFIYIFCAQELVFCLLFYAGCYYIDWGQRLVNQLYNS